MPQYYPVVVQAGRNLAGDSLGFHAYSLRVDNCTNQWYLEETSLAYIPPYSLGLCLRLYGTGVAILLASAPIGQAQLAPITGEQVVGVYSDQLRTEVAASPIRQFTLVQSVSDLTQGAMPANPPVGITRMWAANNGDLHYLLPNGVDATLLSTTNYASYVAGSPLGGNLFGTVSNGNVGIRQGTTINMYDSGGTSRAYLMANGTEALYFCAPGTQFRWVNQGNSVAWALLQQSAFYVYGTIYASGGYLHTDDGANGIVYSDHGGLYLRSVNGSVTIDGNGLSSNLNVGGGINVNGPGTSSVASTINSNITFTANGTTWHNGPFVLQQGISPAAAQSGTIYWHNNQTVYTYLNFPYLYFQNCHPVADQFIISGSSYSYIAFGRGAANEISANVHLYVPGNIAYAGSIGPSSTIRVKKNLAPIDPKESLTLVMDPRTKSYRYEPIEEPPENSNEAHAQRIGFIAEEMLEVVPEVVILDGEGLPASMDYTQLVPLLWGAVRALEGRITALEPVA